jgi:uncharacterized Zn finger protein
MNKKSKSKNGVLFRFTFSSLKEKISIYIIFIFCCILYIFSIILMEDNNFTETGLNTLDSDKKIDTDNTLNSLVGENTRIKIENHLTHNKNSLVNINFSCCEDLSNKYKGYLSDNSNNNKILNEVYKLEVEKNKQYFDLEAETIKTAKDYHDTQEKLDNLSKAKFSEEFSKMSKDIKNLANYNIYEEERYLRDKKNEYLAKLSDLQLKKINILLKTYK